MNDRSVAAIVKAHVFTVLKDCDGNITAASKILGVCRRTLGMWVSELGAEADGRKRQLRMSARKLMDCSNVGDELI